MATRRWPGLGPVFAYEWRAASRRWQGYALRSLLVLLLLLGLSGVWLGSDDGTGELSVQQWAEIGRGFYAVTTLIVLGLVGLAAPAATAGAICLDKARGNLTLLFATDLTDAEIVLGKLAARLVPVLGLIACAAPVQALATLLGGVDPAMPTGAILVCLACAVCCGGCHADKEVVGALQPHGEACRAGKPARCDLLPRTRSPDNSTPGLRTRPIRRGRGGRSDHDTRAGPACTLDLRDRAGGQGADIPRAEERLSRIASRALPGILKSACSRRARSAGRTESTLQTTR